MDNGFKTQVKSRHVDAIRHRSARTEYVFANAVYTMREGLPESERIPGLLVSFHLFHP